MFRSVGWHYLDTGSKILLNDYCCIIFGDIIVSCVNPCNSFNESEKQNQFFLLENFHDMRVYPSKISKDKETKGTGTASDMEEEGSVQKKIVIKKNNIMQHPLMDLEKL